MDSQVLKLLITVNVEIDVIYFFLKKLYTLECCIHVGHSSAAAQYISSVRCNEMKDEILTQVSYISRCKTSKRPRVECQKGAYM